MLTARSTASRKILSEQKWLLLLFDIAKYGTNRVRQGVFRLLRTLLSAMPPTRVQQLLSFPAQQEQLEEQEEQEEQQVQEEPENGFVKWLLNEKYAWRSCWANTMKMAHAGKKSSTSDLQNSGKYYQFTFRPKKSNLMENLKANAFLSIYMSGLQIVTTFPRSGK